VRFQDKLLDTYGSVCRLKGELGVSLYIILGTISHTLHELQKDQLWVADPRAMHEILIKGHDDFKEPESMLTCVNTCLCCTGN
jgi:hypothetical protein